MLLISSCPFSFNFPHLGISLRDNSPPTAPFSVFLLTSFYFRFSSCGNLSELHCLDSFLPFFYVDFPHPSLLLSSQLQNILRTAGTVSKYVFECEQLTLPELGLDDGQMTPDSVLEPGGSLRTSSGSSGSGGGVDCRTIRCTAATTEVIRKKRSSVAGFRAVAAASCRPGCSPTPEIVAAGRRKGTPHRSPLY